MKCNSCYLVLLGDLGTRPDEEAIVFVRGLCTTCMPICTCICIFRRSMSRWE